MSKLKGFFGVTGSEGDKPAAEEGKADESSDSEETASASDESVTDESGSDDNDDDAEFTREIQALRDKYEKLKEKNRQLRAEKKDESSGKKDNSEFSKIIASFFAIEGSVAQLKLSLKKHADQNGFPVDGLGLDDGAAPTEAPAEEAPIPEPESDTEMNAAAAAAGATGAAASSSITPPESTLPLPSENAVAEQGAAGAPPGMAPEAVAPAIPELDQSSSDSESGFGSDSELTSIPVNDTNPPELSGASAGEQAAPSGTVEGSTPVVPDDQAASSEVPNEGTPAGAPAPAATGAPPATGTELFSGGKNHYIQGMKKNKTHRHHKRRNRHQTLRKK
jgi:hypothetical protein